MSPEDPRHGRTTGYRMGCRDKCCRDAMAVAEARRRKRRYLLRVESLRVPNIGTKRRIQALAAIGWSISAVSREAGYDRSHLALMLRRSGPLHIDTATRIQRVYDRLSMTLPPETTKVEKIDASRARNLAARRGWAPPLAWLDIDDPNEQPEVRGQHRERPGRPETLDATLEDFDWLVSAGESPEKAARRVGVALVTIRDYRSRQARRVVA